MSIANAIIAGIRRIVTDPPPPNEAFVIAPSIMATRDPRSFEADNMSGSRTLAAHKDWRNDDEDSISARDANEPTDDAG